MIWVAGNGVEITFLLALRDPEVISVPPVCRISLLHVYVAPIPTLPDLVADMLR